MNVLAKLDVKNDDYSNKITVSNKKLKILDHRYYKNSHELLQILAKNRNISDLNKVLSINLNNSLPDPYNFIDMQKACEKTFEAIKNNKSIVIFGDYDVDGVSSTAILVKFFNHIKVKNSYLIPNRFEEGYGISVKNLEKYKNSLIITVDTGSSAIKELEFAKAHNIDLIVLDHHNMHEIPKGIPIVNPHRPDEKTDYKYLCAAGIVFLFVIGLNRLLRENNFYNTISEPNLLNFTDLAALATVADVVDVVSLNRAIVSTGLKIIKKEQNPGISALLSLSNSRAIDSEAIAYFLAPRINAAGRLDSAKIATRLLTTTDPLEAKALALKLDELNKSRQQIETSMILDAEPMINKENNFICVYKEDWHIGVIGILAGRLKEKFNKPTIVLAKNAENIARASCRSIANIDVSLIIKKAIEQNIIISGGGHALAGGFSIEISKISELENFLKKELLQQPPLPEIIADSILNLDLLSIDFVQDINVLAPFGAANRRPKFVIENKTPIGAKIVGEKHISFSIPYNNSLLKSICFNSVGTKIEEFLFSFEPLSYIGEILISTWKDSTYLNFYLEDLIN